MTGMLALRAMLFAGECLVVSGAIFAAAFFAQRFIERAGLRHAVWLAAFALVVAFPLAAALAPSVIVIETSAPKVLTAPLLLPSSQAAIAAMPSSGGVWQLPAFDHDLVALALFAVWFAGFAWQMGRLIVGALGLWTLRRDSRPHPIAPGDLPKIDFRGRECELRLSASDAGPMTWGVVRSIVLLPHAARFWSAERMRAVLLHELAHVRRRDSLTQSLAGLVAAVYWINPLVWLGLKRLTAEAEMACDDAVIGFGVRPSSYASELLSLASQFRVHALAPSGVAMASQSSLSARIASVLSAERSRKPANLKDVLKLGAIGLVMTAGLALVNPALGAAPVPVVPPAKPVPVIPQVDATHATPAAPIIEAVPAMPAEPASYDAHFGHARIVVIDEHGNRLEGEAARAYARDQIRRAREEIARIRPQIDRALAEARVEEKVARAMADAHVAERIQQAMKKAHVDVRRALVEARIHEKVAQALAMAEPEMRRALADAHIDEKVAKAMREAEARIDASLARAHDAHGTVIIGPDDEPDAEDASSDDGDEGDPGESD